MNDLEKAELFNKNIEEVIVGLRTTVDEHMAEIPEEIRSKIVAGMLVGAGLGMLIEAGVVDAEIMAILKGQIAEIRKSVKKS